MAHWIGAEGPSNWSKIQKHDLFVTSPR